MDKIDKQDKIKISLNTECFQAVFLGVPDVPGVAAKVFQTIAEHGIGVNMIIQNPMKGGRTDLAFLTCKDRIDKVIPLCLELSDSIGGQGVSFYTEIGALTLESHDLAQNPEVTAKVFSALGSAGINVENISANASALTCIVGGRRAGESLRIVQKALA